MGCILSNKKDINEYEIIRVIDERTIDIRKIEDVKNNNIQTVILNGILPYDNEPMKRKNAIHVLTTFFLQHRRVNILFTNQEKNECRMNLMVYPYLNVNDWMISRGHARKI